MIWHLIRTKSGLDAIADRFNGGTQNTRTRLSPGRDERNSQRDETIIMDQRAMHEKCLSPLRGFWEEIVDLGPTDESVGYCRMSLRDKGTFTGRPWRNFRLHRAMNTGLGLAGPRSHISVTMRVSIFVSGPCGCSWPRRRDAEFHGRVVPMRTTIVLPSRQGRPTIAHRLIGGLMNPM